MRTKLLCGLLCLFALSGCALERVHPWDRADLAQPEMGWDPGLSREGVMKSHTYVSKEAASGGASLGGGGCGCN